MAKLTEAQVRALTIAEIAPIEITMWGGKPFAGMPDGIRSTATLSALWFRRLLNFSIDGTTHIWTITPAGRAALAEASK